VDEDPLLQLDVAQETSRKRLRRRVIAVALICLPLALCAWAIVAAITNLAISRFEFAFDVCADEVSNSGTVIYAAADDAKDRRVRQLPALDGAYPGLSGAFAAMQSECFDQKSLPAFDQDREGFNVVRDGALDAWRQAKSPAVDAAPGLSGEEQLLNAAADFLDNVVVPRLETMEPPSVLDTFGVHR